MTDSNLVGLIGATCYLIGLVVGYILRKITEK